MLSSSVTFGARPPYARLQQKIKGLVALSIPHPRGIAGDPRALLKANHPLLPAAVSQRIVWSHDFAHINRIYRRWAPNFDPSANEMEAIKSTLKAPGAVAGALNYYWSFFRSGFAAAGVASDGLVTVPALVLAG